MVLKNVTSLTELKTLVNQGGKTAVLYDVNSGEPYGLDLEVLINMDASISGMDASVGQVWTMAETIAQETVDATTELIEGYVADASTSSAEAIAAAAAFPTTHPETALYSRWLADTGTQFDVDLAMQAYEKMKAADPNTVFVFMPHVASKIRTSGVNKYMNKMYSLKSATYDAVQSVDAVQPFVGGYIAPNEKIGLKYMQGQTQTGLVDFADKTYAANASWTLTSRLKVNNKGTARIYLGSAYIQFSSTAVSLHNGSVEMLSLTYNFDCGKVYTVSFQYDNGVGSIVINSVNYTVPAASASITFGQISYNSSFKFDGAIYSLVLQDGRKSSYQSQLDHQILSTFFPDVETIGIGYQKWATSNFDGIVAGGGTVIQEVQGATTDGNAELITNHTFDDSTGWGIAGPSTISGGVARVYAPAAELSQISTATDILIPGKWYRLTYDVVSNVSGSVTVTNSGAPLSTTVGTGKVHYFLADATRFFIKRLSICDITFDNIYIKEVGASDSTNVYNYIYATTSGSEAVKDLAATKAAAGWCYYNNDPALGAIYGKLYNWYAGHLFDLVGVVREYRVTSKSDFDQVIANQGGSTVAGKKLKAKFGGYDNTNASNESGFSAIPSGYRNELGVFTGATTTERFWTSTANDATTAYAVSIVDTDALASSVTLNKTMMLSLRLLRNAPNVPDTSEIQTNWITTNFASGTANVDLTIPFGCVVDFVRVLSRTGITSMQGVLYTGAGVAKETLFSGATVVADTPIELNTRVNQSIQQTNGFVRFNGVKADTGGLMMIVVGLKRAYNTEQL